MGRVLRRKAASTRLSRERHSAVIHMFLRFRISLWPLFSMIFIGGFFILFRQFDVTKDIFLSAGLTSFAGLFLTFISMIFLMPEGFLRTSGSKEWGTKVIESHAAVLGTFTLSAAMIYIPMFFNSVLYGVMGFAFFAVFVHYFRSKLSEFSDEYKVGEPELFSRLMTLVIALASVFYGDALGYSPVSYSAVAFVFVLWFLIVSDRMILARYKGA